MERIEPDLEKGDSGWFINTLEDDSEDIEYEAIYAFQLLYLRPEIMSVLILPPEFIVLVDKNTIEKVINEKKMKLFGANKIFDKTMEYLVCY